MKILREYSQSQGLLLIPSLDEFVLENQEARIVNEVVNTMDLSPLLAEYEGGGAPAYHPAMMGNAKVHLWIFQAILSQYGDSVSSVKSYLEQAIG
jgi:transposase